MSVIPCNPLIKSRSLKTLVGNGEKCPYQLAEFLISRLRPTQAKFFCPFFPYQRNVSRDGTECPIALEGPEITAHGGSSKRLGVRKPRDSTELEDREELSEMTKRSQDGPYRFPPACPQSPWPADPTGSSTMKKHLPAQPREICSTLGRYF